MLEKDANLTFFRFAKSPRATAMAYVDSKGRIIAKPAWAKATDWLMSLYFGILLFLTTLFQVSLTRCPATLADPRHSLQQAHDSNRPIRLETRKRASEAVAVGAAAGAVVHDDVRGLSPILDQVCRLPNPRASLMPDCSDSCITGLLWRYVLDPTSPFLYTTQSYLRFVPSFKFVKSHDRICRLAPAFRSGSMSDVTLLLSAHRIG